MSIILLSSLLFYANKTQSILRKNVSNEINHNLIFPGSQKIADIYVFCRFYFLYYIQNIYG